MGQHRCQAGAALLRAAPAQHGSDHERLACRRVAGNADALQALARQAQGLHQEGLGNRIALRRFERFHGIRHRVQRGASHQIGGRCLHEPGVDEDAARAGLGIEQRQPLTLGVVHRGASFREGRARRRRHHQQRQLRCVEARALELAIGQPAGAQLGEGALLAGQDGRSACRHCGRAATDRDDRVGLRLFEERGRLFDARDRAVLARRRGDAGEQRPERIAQQFELGTAADGPATDDHRAAAAEACEFLLQCRQALAAVRDPQFCRHVLIGQGHGDRVRLGRPVGLNGKRSTGTALTARASTQAPR